MSHAQTPAFHNLTVLDTHDESSELRHLTLGRADAAFLQAHRLAGQYVQVQGPGEKSGFFALASQPGNEWIELLIRRGPPLAEAICAVPAGGTLRVSAPAGKGYPLESLRGHDVLLAGVGSAMAPLRAAVQYILRERDAFGAVNFYYGARGLNWVPYYSEVQAWTARGIQVHFAYSEFHADGSFSGERVQDLLLRQRPALSARTGVLVCGMKGMVAEVAAACGELGLPEERVFQNF